MENLVKLLPVIAVVALVVIIFLLGYVKAPPDVAYIISGIRKRPRVLIGRAGIRIPFLERVDKSSLSGKSPSTSSRKAISRPTTSSASMWTRLPRSESRRTRKASSSP